MSFSRFISVMVERMSIAALRLLGLQEAAVAAAFWRESRDRRLRLDEDLLEQPLLGMISSGNNAMATLRLSGR